MSVFLYSEVNIICVAILLILLLRISRSGDSRYKTSIFVQIILISIFFIIIDLLWGHISMGFIEKSYTMLHLLNIVYYTVAGLLSCIWLYYSEIFLKPRWSQKSFANLIFIIPAVSVFFIMVVSSITGISYYIDDNFEYQKGPLYICQIVFAYYPLVVASARAFYYSRKKENYAIKGSLTTMASFPLFPLVFGVVQVINPLIPLLSVGIMLGILVVYLNGLDAKISLDTLTQINNRNQFMINLTHEMADEKNNKSLYLFMIDADYFKEINDEYGHTEGDRALVRIAHVLKKVASVYNCSIYRFGGDEFAMLTHAQTNDEADGIREHILNVLRDNNETNVAPYNLSVSIGYARYDTSIASIPDYISIADDELYKVKKRTHANR